MENELELKWRRIQQAMRQEEADGCLLTMNMNLYYVSGQVFNGYFIFRRRDGLIGLSNG